LEPSILVPPAIKAEAPQAVGRVQGHKNDIWIDGQVYGAMIDGWIVYGAMIDGLMDRFMMR